MSHHQSPSQLHQLWQHLLPSAKERLTAQLVLLLQAGVMGGRS